MRKVRQFNSRGFARLAALLFSASSLALSMSGCGQLAQSFSQVLGLPSALTPSVPPVCVQPPSAVPAQVQVPAQGSFPAGSVFEIEGSFSGVSIDAIKGTVTVNPVGYGIPLSLIEIPVKVTSPGNQIARYNARVFFKACPEKCAADEIFNSVSGLCEKCALGEVPNPDKTACVSCTNGADNPLACDHCPLGKVMIGGACVAKNDCDSSQLGKGFTYDAVANACVCASPKEVIGGLCVTRNNCTATQIAKGFTYDSVTNSCTCVSPNIIVADRCEPKNDCTASQLSNGYTYDGLTNTCSCAPPKVEESGTCNKTTAGSFDYESSYKACFSAGFASFQIPVQSNSLKGADRFIIASVKRDTSTVSPPPTSISVSRATGTLTIGSPLTKGVYEVEVHAYQNGQYNPANPNSYVASVATFEIVDCADLFYAEYSASCSAKLSSAKTITPASSSYKKPSGWTLQVLSPSSPAFSVDSTGKITIPAGTAVGVYPIVIRATDPLHAGVYVDRTVTVDVRDCTANTVSYVSLGADQCSSTAFSLNPTFASGSNTWGVFEIRAMIRDGVSLTTYPSGITVNSSSGVLSVAAGVPAGRYTVTLRASDAKDPSIYVETTATFKVIDCLSGSWSLKYQSAPNLCFSGSFTEYLIQVDSSSRLSGVDTFELVAPVDSGFDIDSATGTIKVSKAASVAIHQIKVRAYQALSYVSSNPATYVETTVKVTVTNCSTLFNISFPEVCADPTADFLLEYEPGYVKPTGWVLSVVEPVPFVMDGDGKLNASMKTCKDSGGNLISQDCLLVQKAAGPGVHTFTVRAKDPNSSAYIEKTVTLTLDDCTPAPAALIVLDSNTFKDQFDYGDVKVPDSSAYEEFTVFNVGDTDAKLENPIYATATAKNGAGTFDIDDAWVPPPGVVKCAKGVVLAKAGGQCRMRVRFTAIQKGPDLAELFAYAEGGIISSPARLSANSIMGILVRENQFNPIDFSNVSGEDLVVQSHTTGTNKKPGGAQLDHYNLGGKPFPGTTTSDPTARTGYHPVIGYMDEVYTDSKRTGYATDLARSVSSVRGAQTHDFDVVPDDTTCGFFRVGHFVGANAPNAPMVWGANLPPRSALPYATELATNYTVTGMPLLPSGSVYLRAEDNDPIFRDDLFNVPDVNGNVIPRWLPVNNANPAANFLQLYNQLFNKPAPGIVGNDIKNFLNVGAATQLRDLYHTFNLNHKYTGQVRDKNGTLIDVDVDYRNICGVYMQISASPNTLAFGAAVTADPVATNFLQFFSTLAQDSSIDRRVWGTRFDDLYKPHPNSPGLTFTDWLNSGNNSRHLFLLELQNLVSGNWGLNSVMNHFGEQLNVRFSIPSMEINSVALLVYYHKDKVRKPVDEWTPPQPSVPPVCNQGQWGDWVGGVFVPNSAYTDLLKQQYPDVTYTICGGAAKNCANFQGTCAIDWKCKPLENYDAFKKRVENESNACQIEAQNTSAAGGAHVLDPSQCCQDCGGLKKDLDCWGACKNPIDDGKGGYSGSSDNNPIPYTALNVGERCNSNGTKKSDDDIQKLIDKAEATAKKQCTPPTGTGYLKKPSCDCSPYTSSWSKKYFDQDDCDYQKKSTPSYTHSHSDTYWCELDIPPNLDPNTGSYKFKYKLNNTYDAWTPNDPSTESPSKTIGTDIFEEHPCPKCQPPKVRTQNYWEKACPRMPHACKQVCRDYTDDNSDATLRSSVQWGSTDSSGWYKGTWEVDGKAKQASCPKTNWLSYEPKCCDPDAGTGWSINSGTPPPDFVKNGPNVTKYDANGCPVDCTTTEGCTDDKVYYRYFKLSGPDLNACTQNGVPYTGVLSDLKESGDQFQCCMTTATGTSVGTVGGGGGGGVTRPGWSIDLNDTKIVNDTGTCCEDPKAKGSKFWIATCCQLPKYATDPLCNGGGGGKQEDTEGGWFDPSDPNGGKHFGPP